MYHTPDDARKKWCPFTRVGLTVGNSPNRTASMPECGAPAGGEYSDITDETRCFGDRCAVWIFSSEEPQKGRCGLVNPHITLIEVGTA
jgi:hypothetical protein